MPQIAAWPNLDRILARRVDQFADELGFDRERIVSWGIVQAVLSAWWSVEDQGYGWEPALKVAETLARLWRRGEALSLVRLAPPARLAPPPREADSTNRSVVAIRATTSRKQCRITHMSLRRLTRIVFREMVGRVETT